MNKRMVAIDPGEKHCGVSIWYGERMTGAYEAETPGHLIISVRQWVATGAVDELVVEEYRLYPWASDAQAFTQIKTIEVIGVLRYLAAEDGVPMVEQGAAIKKPTFAIMRRRGVELPKGSQHVKDAIAHGYYRLHRGQIRVKETTAR